jgi:hypothetical protein
MDERLQNEFIAMQKAGTATVREKLLFKADQKPITDFKQPNTSVI